MQDGPQTDMGNTQSIPSQIQNSLGQINDAVHGLDMLIDDLRGQTAKLPQDEPATQPTIAFNELYSGLPDAISNMATHIRDQTLTLRQMILG